MKNLSPIDFEDFFIRTYFGEFEDYIDASIRRAYLDFNRTLHGMAGLERREELFEESRKFLRSKIDSLKDKDIDLTEFDQWHYQACMGLKQIYTTYSYTFNIGQAQKWINMTLKYMFALREERVGGYTEVYQFCHIPIDNIILDKFRKYNMPKFFNCKWSRINDYQMEYLSFQKWIRSTFPQFIPLELEFLLWLNKDNQKVGIL
ncbi:hypothetical protein YDYSG_27530 [Paenibacillus tyrfis]|uniref:hypothetical protein n=1 Tax=Paenibacillus tyrfis TaxID=1501230 RepID=UPI00249188C3|nr:hypothetical protein [Paenibacillus tyrfis]GLI06723.1 hypothetical protein YDYSG_27530 [Paenibacillus tyrfis]